MVNGRISDGSLRGYQRLKPFLGPVLKNVDLFCMQTEESAQRIIDLGVSKNRVRMTGNIKFDISSQLKESPLLARFKNIISGSLLFVAGSTHEGEEEAIVAIYQSLRKDFSRLRLLIAPRHLDRMDKIRRLVRQEGLESLFFSRLSSSFSSGQVVLLDTIGDLNSLYGFCDVAFVGGSLVEKGGHNLIEPALFGKPIFFGRHMENFKEIRDIFIRHRAAIEINSAQELEYELRRLLGDPQERKALGERARNLLESNRGAAQRTFSEILKIMKT